MRGDGTSVRGPSLGQGPTGPYRSALYAGTGRGAPGHRSANPSGRPQPAVRSRLRHVAFQPATRALADPHRPGEAAALFRRWVHASPAPTHGASRCSDRTLSQRPVPTLLRSRRRAAHPCRGREATRLPSTARPDWREPVGGSRRSITDSWGSTSSPHMGRRNGTGSEWLDPQDRSPQVARHARS